MASGARRLGFSFLLLALVIGGLLATVVLVSHKAAVDRANRDFPASIPVTATFSRFHLGRQHTVSVVWKLHFVKSDGSTPSVAAWHLQPFGLTEFEGGRR